MHGKTLLWGAALLMVLGPTAGCQDTREPTAPLTTTRPAVRTDRSQVVPSPLATVTAGSKSVTFWAYTGDNFSNTPVDPISFVFPGADPRQIRALLLSVNGDRSGFGMPTVKPFNCTWKDATGGSNQTAYSNESGWVGSAIQLTCGGYDVRYHIRLFQVGDFVLGAAHFEVNIPGTWMHESLSWDRAQELVLVDLLRTGMVNPSYTPVPTGSTSPYYRTINPQVWYPLAAGQPALAAYVGAVVDGSVVRILNNGVALKVSVLGAPPIAPMDQTEEFDLPIAQGVPRPFCNTGPLDLVYVSGTLHISRHTVVDESGGYHNRQQMQGRLEGTPISPSGAPIGATFHAIVDDINTGVYSPNQNAISLYTKMQTMPNGQGSSTRTLTVGPGNSSNFDYQERCD